MNKWPLFGIRGKFTLHQRPLLRTNVPFSARYQDMAMGIESQEIAKGLDGDDGAGKRCISLIPGFTHLDICWFPIDLLVGREIFVLIIFVGIFSSKSKAFPTDFSSSL